MPITYEIRIRGRASHRLLRPMLDDFTIDHDGNGDTRMVGDIVDPAQLHGVLAHLTALNAEVISVARATPMSPAPTDPPDHHGERL